MTQRSEFVDAKGRTYLIGEAVENAHSDLTHMYEVFRPKPIAQGLPPADDDIRRLWVHKLAYSSINVGAWIGDDMVGHAAVITDVNQSDGEYIIFVLTEYRNLGLGSQLTRLATLKAREAGLKSMWLTVESYNFRAIRVYKKVGFEFCDEDDSERTMILSL